MYIQFVQQRTKIQESPPDRYKHFDWNELAIFYFWKKVVRILELESRARNFVVVEHIRKLVLIGFSDFIDQSCTRPLLSFFLFSSNFRGVKKENLAKNQRKRLIYANLVPRAFPYVVGVDRNHNIGKSPGNEV